MKNLTIEQANRIITEFMGLEFESLGNREGEYRNMMVYRYEGRRCVKPAYSESLDALVPVWEKLKGHYEIDFFDEGRAHFNVVCPEYNEVMQMETESNIFKAACIATAKAIKELQNEQR